MTETTVTVPLPSEEILCELHQGLSAYRSEFECDGDDMTDHYAALAWLEQVEAVLCLAQEGRDSPNETGRLEEMAASLFKRMEHLDPTEDLDLERDDWGYGVLDERRKQFYRLCVEHVLHGVGIYVS